MTHGHDMIAEQLERARSNLKVRLDDLDKAKQRVNELAAQCGELQEKVAGLEKDQQALDHGYIALMGDAAHTA